MRPATRHVQLLIAGTVLLALAVVMPMLRRSDPRPEPQPPASTKPAGPVSTTAAATAPARPALTYVEVVRRSHPTLATTQPLATALDLRHAAHLILHEPIHLDLQGHLWITHPDAEESAHTLAQASAATVQLTRRHVLFVHWAPDRTGQWTPHMVCRDPTGGIQVVGLDRGDAIYQQPVGGQRKYDWDAAFTWHQEQKVVVPTDTGVSVFDPQRKWAESASPPLIEPGQASAPIQVLLDVRGLIAWSPPEAGRPGSRGVLRFVDDQWKRLAPEQGWPADLLHLVPLLDGSVLQIVAGPRDTVTFGMASVEPPKADERQVLALVDRLAHPDEKERDEAYAQLTRYAQSLWPIIERVMKDQVAEVQLRLRELLKMKVTPGLGGMSVVEQRMRLVSRQRDGGALFYAEKGVQRPRPNEEPEVIEPAWIVARPGHPIRVLDPAMASLLEVGRDYPTRFEDDWVTISPTTGPRHRLGNALLPLLRKTEHAFAYPVGVDRQGRWLFRQPAGGPATSPSDLSAGAIRPTPTLVIDPTLPDPTPRMPVWLIRSEGAAVGWTADGYPAQAREGSPWALEEKGWRYRPNEQIITTLQDSAPPPATGPEPAQTCIFADSDGNRYYDGLKSLKIRYARGARLATWAFPAAAEGDGPPRLIRTGDGRLYLFNHPGRVLRLRPTPDASEPFALEATFVRRIPDSDQIQRLWLDPAGRIAIAYDKEKLAILFPQGYIPPAIWNLMPAEQQDAAVEEEP